MVPGCIPSNVCVSAHHAKGQFEFLLDCLTADVKLPASVVQSVHFVKNLSGFFFLLAMQKDSFDY